MKVMKKIITSIGSFFNKILVVPISKLILLINKKYEKPSRFFENWLSKTNTLIFVSLLLAIIIFIVIDQRMLLYSESSAEVFNNLKVTPMYDEDNYVVEGIPDSVDITLIGNKADLYIAKQSPTNKVTLDLWGLKPGTHKVDIKYNQISDSIKYSVNPSVATVIIYEKVSTNKTVTVDLLNQDSLDNTYIVDEPKIFIDSVVIKGASYKVEEVATVKALVDVKSLPKFELGKSITVSSTLKAYDELGNVVDVEISPSKVDVELLVTSPSKEVPIQVVPKGNVIYTMGISSLNVNNNENTTVMVYGPEELLSTIEYIPVEVDVEGLSESTEFKVDLDKPAGVKSLSINNVTVNVTLSKDISNKTIQDVGITYKNLGEGYGVTPIDVDSVDVQINGVSDIIDDITANDITAYVDLNGLGAGNEPQEVEIKVTGNDPRIKYQSKVLKIKVKIYKKG